MIKPRVLFITNIPSPYKIDFFNELGKHLELTVVFEAKRARGITFNWNEDSITTFNAIFLSDQNINERKIDFSIRKILKKNSFDFIYATNYAYLTELYAIIYLIIHKIPYYIELDGALLKHENKLIYWMKKTILTKAVKCLSPSEVTDNFLKYYGVEHERIIRYPFTSLSRKDILNSVISVDDKKMYKKQCDIVEKKAIIAVGQFIHRKGFDTLINSMKQISDDIGVYIIGGEPTEEYVSLKNNFKLNNLHFCGFKTKEELKKYYMAADLFVLPTREDIWGLVINEAMANGLPIITTNKCGAGLELVSDWENGFIIDVEDSTMLADRINTVLKDEKLMNSMSNESLSIIANYTIENMVKKHTDEINAT